MRTLGRSSERSAPVSSRRTGRQGIARARVDSGTWMSARAETVARDALVQRLFEAAVATFDLYGVYLGDRLGLYRALAGGRSSTAAELARSAGIHPRYAREWLEQQAASGILGVENEEDAPDERRFFVPPGHEEVLL